jgi:hypothetical protein
MKDRIKEMLASNDLRGAILALTEATEKGFQEVAIEVNRLKPQPKPASAAKAPAKTKG